MSKFPSVTGSQLIKAIRKLGFEVILVVGAGMFPAPKYCGSGCKPEPAKMLYEKAKKDMSDLKKYIAERKKKNKKFAEGFDEGYEQFKIGIILRQAREAAGLTQEELAARIKTKKTAISRIENHAEDIKLSTLERVANALGKKLQIHISP